MTTLLLRSPPFARVAEAVAAVSGEGATIVDASSAFAAIRAARVGGTFWAPPAERGEGPIAIASAEAPARVPAALAAARSEAGRRPVLLVPDVRWARRLVPVDATVVRGVFDPWSLLGGDVVVYSQSDAYEFAALAIVAGVPVRGVAPDVARLLSAAAYRDPFGGGVTGIDEAIAQLAEWRRLIDANRGVAAATGVAWWKRPAIERFLEVPGRGRIVVPNQKRALAVARAGGGAIAVWPSRVGAALIDDADAAGVPIHRIEDGFIRSVGLGSALHPPQSVAIDRRGIHYDPSRASDLETLLETADLAPLLTRARVLAGTIVARGIGKYGAGTGAGQPPHEAGRRLVLVAGQVEDDLSVMLGGGEVMGNRDLLARARALEPDAEIWFRPHPDIDAGHRRGAIPDADALAFADRIVRGGAMAGLLDRVDGVHVLTSLTGFEALLRRRDVTVHGTPFYSGWGLTRDAAAQPARRTRRLSLDELAAGVLIAYPRYLDPVTGLPCSPEVLVDRLAQQAAPQATWLTRLRRVQGRLARLAGMR